MKRSTQPVFWLLFGAGGMLSATMGIAAVVVTGLALPFGFGYDDAVAFARHWAGKGLLWVVVSLFLWHGAHRIFHSLHDLGIHAKAASAIACYGLALAGTLVSASALLRIGF